MIMSNTITLYHYLGDGRWKRTVIKGVQYKHNHEKAIDANGSLKIVDYASVTIPFVGEKYDFGLDNKDIIIPMASTTEMTEDNFREIADLGITIQSVADNTNRQYLKHWRVIGQ